MNKKIVLSLATIGAVGAIAIGGTIAQFKDLEKATGTFTSGTIDIAIDGQNPWNKTYNTGDLKPGQTGNITFDVQNVGQNAVSVSKTLSNFVNTGGAETYPCAGLAPAGTGMTSSEPECEAEKANSNIRKDDVQSQIIYDLNVEVYSATSTDKIWWQTIYTDAEGKSLTAVYGTNGGSYVTLGTIPAGGHMIVKQSYHFDSKAGNEYQGDTLSFDMTIASEQLPQGDEGRTTVALENKVQGDNSDWSIVQGDNIEGTLNYIAQGPKFDYSFTGKVKTDGSYILLYVGSTNDYPCVGSVVLVTDNFVAGTAKTITGQVDIGGNIANGKIWLIPAGSYSGGVMTSWPASDILFETGLINYVKN